MSHRHTPNIRSWVFKINKKASVEQLEEPNIRIMLKKLIVDSQIVSLTELMAGVKAPSKTCQVFQLMCWPQGHKVPTSTNSLVELMNMVERWRQKTDYGPVVVVSQYVVNELVEPTKNTLKTWATPAGTVRVAPASTAPPTPALSR